MDCVVSLMSGKAFVTTSDWRAFVSGMFMLHRGEAPSDRTFTSLCHLSTIMILHSFFFLEIDVLLMLWVDCNMGYTFS